MNYNQIKLLMLAFTAQPPENRDEFFKQCKSEIEHMVSLEVAHNALSVHGIKVHNNLISINDGPWLECLTRQTPEDRHGIDIHLPSSYKLENRN